MVFRRFWLRKYECTNRNKTALAQQRKSQPAFLSLRARDQGWREQGHTIVHALRVLNIRYLVRDPMHSDWVYRLRAYSALPFCPSCPAHLASLLIAPNSSGHQHILSWPTLRTLVARRPCRHRLSLSAMMGVSIRLSLYTDQPR